MRRLSAGLIAAAVLLPFAPSVGAQTKTVTGEMVTVTATVEAVEASTRTITLKGPKGNYVDVVAPDTVTRFSEIKVGDTITAKYYENLVLRVKGPNNWTYSSRVEDKKALATVKVGDKVDITWTYAMLVSFAEAKK